MSDDRRRSGYGEPLIRVEGLTKDYRTPAETISVLRGIDLWVRAGEMLAIIGPSGSGKSTLLFILGLFLDPTRGAYRSNGTDVFGLNPAGRGEFRRRCVGFVFQRCNLVECATVYENLEFPLVYAGVDRAERPGRIREALAKVDLGHRIHHPASQLSGGEQQRVAIARAFINRPRVILADEPTGQIDRMHSQLVMDHFQQLVLHDGAAVVVVTHDAEVARRCTRICRLADGLLHPAGMEEL